MIQHYLKRLLPFFLLLIQCAIAQGQDFRMVKDINTISSSSPYNYYDNATGYRPFAVLNNVSYFVADDGVHGTELWRSDGTTAGTYMVKDMIPGSGSPGINGIIVSNGKLFISASGTIPIGLWTSDGTENGTQNVMDVVPPGLGNFMPYYLTAVNGLVFFVIDGFANKSQLWVTDGTENGTKMAVNFYSPQYSNSITLNNLVNINGRLYFTLITPSSNAGFHTRLWSIDGSLQGITADAALMSSTAWDPAQVTRGVTNGPVTLTYFTATSASDPTRKLWVSTGQADQAGLAAGNNGVLVSPSIGTPIININNVLYLAGSTSGNANGLYKYDFNAGNGLVLVTNIVFSSPYALITGLANVNNTLFISALAATSGTNNKGQLWKSDGTAAGTKLLTDNVFINGITAAGNTLYFSGTDTVGAELWKSDGSPAGTVRVKDINPGPLSSNAGNLSRFTQTGSNILFGAYSASGLELWKTDGTEAGTTLVKDINTASSGSSSGLLLTAFKSRLFMTAFDGPLRSLWSSNGTADSTISLGDIQPESFFYSPKFAATASNLFFWGRTSAGGWGLCKSDGTAAGTIMVKDFVTAGVSFYWVATTGNLAFFSLRSSTTNSYSLWRSDGTAAGTYSVEDNVPQIAESNLPPAALGNTLFFIQAGVNGYELWKSDGSVAGTIRVKDLFPGNNAAPHDLCNYKGKIYFSARDGAGEHLWSTDGTNTVIVKDLDVIDNLLVSGNTLYLTANSADGIELWKTDGTTAGTKQVFDINPGNVGSNPAFLTDVSGTLYFFAADATHGIELWKTDGTAEATKLVKDITPGGGSTNLSNVSFPDVNIAAAGGRLFLLINRQLWASDGTEEGTLPVEDVNLRNVSNIHYLTEVNGQLYFLGYTYQYGEELYTGQLQSTTLDFCPGGSLSVNSNITGNSYQWQVKFSFTDWIDISSSPGEMFKGSQTSHLTRADLQSVFSGSQLRCRVDGNRYSNTYTIQFKQKWNGMVDSKWEEPDNWECGSIPDENTDVVVDAGIIVINSAVTVKSIIVKPGVTITVSPNAKFTLSGK